MKSLGDDSLPIDVTKDERTESALSHKNIMEISQGKLEFDGVPAIPERTLDMIDEYRLSAATIFYKSLQITYFL